MYNVIPFTKRFVRVLFIRDDLAGKKNGLNAHIIIYNVKTYNEI
jgi:hypothetical protein